MPRKKTSRELLSDSARGFAILEDEIKNAEYYYQQYKKQLSTMKGRITKKKSNKYPDQLFTSIITNLKEGDLMPSILRSEIDKATEVNTEFERSLYKASLYAAAGDKDIYKLIKTGEGWSSNLTVQIVMEEGAGDIQDWSKGILMFRADLKTKIKKGNSKAGQRATYWWLNNVWGSGLEVKTIAKRLEYSNRVAPFWRLLNSGSVPMLSDRPDGSFNPIPARPTNFIGEAEYRIRLYFTALFYPEKAQWMQEISALQEEQRYIENAIESYERDLARLSTELSENKEVLRRFKDKQQYVDEDRLTIALRRLRAGEDFDSKYIELTKSGSGGRARVSITNLARKAEGIID